MATAKQLEYMYRWIEKNPFRFMWHNAKARSKRDGRECTITERDVQDAWPADGLCPVLGVRMVLPGRGAAGDCAATLDRVDNSRGYIPGNIAILSKKAGILKRQHDAAKAAVEVATARVNAPELRRVAAWLSERGAV